MYTYYYCVYIYYSDRPGDRILKMFSSQIEYEKKPKVARTQTADRICKQHMQIEYQTYDICAMLHVYAVQYCTACSQYSITTKK